MVGDNAVYWSVCGDCFAGAINSLYRKGVEDFCIGIVYMCHADLQSVMFLPVSRKVFM